MLQRNVFFFATIIKNNSFIIIEYNLKNTICDIIKNKFRKRTNQYIFYIIYNFMYNFYIFIFYI